MNIDYKTLKTKLKKLEKFQSGTNKPSGSLEDWYDVELTHSSNAIEGNSLTRIETAEVMEKGLSANISGKPLKDLLEARNLAEALKYVKKLSTGLKSHQFITEDIILKIHKIILTGIDDVWAGKYRESEIFVRGSNSNFPLPQIVPTLVADLIRWIESEQEENPVKIAADLHYKFVSIHPFIDGNGRTARLLMNLVLAIHGYPMAVIKNEDRSEYLHALETAQTKNNMDEYYKIIFEAVDASLDSYINFYKNRNPLPENKISAKLMRIGELSKQTGETIHTLHFWIKEGLIASKNKTAGGYQLFDAKIIERINKIRDLQKNKRLSLTEIKDELNTN